MSQSRQLAAIMFTDIVGYTKLMQQSESMAVGIRERHREVFDKAHQVYQGKIIQYYGDGTLSIFSNTLDAVHCAIAIQKELAVHPRVPLRIGIHLGDVLLSDSDIIGDSVNIASRVESLGVAGAVLVSDKVWEETKNQNDLIFQFLGTFHFKNDHQSRNIYAVEEDGLVIPEIHQLSGKLENSSIDSLAILPFENLTGDQEQDILIAGIHDNLITAFSRISSLRIISNTSTKKYKHSDKSIVEIANELNVQAIIEASVLRANNNIRLNIQLIKAFPKEEHLWADVLDYPLKEVYALLNEITQTISRKIDLALTPKESEGLSSSSQVNAEAYRLYLRGMFHWEKLSAPDMNTAIQYLKRSIGKDPTYAPAYAGMAIVLISQVQMGLVVPTEVMHNVYRYNQKALNLDPYSFDSLYTKALLHFAVEWSWDESEASFMRALDVNPNHSLCRSYYGHLLMIEKRMDEALIQVKHALELDPINPLVQALAGVVYYYHNDVEQALDLANQSYAMDPSNILVLRLLDMCYYHMKKYDRSIQMQSRLQELSGLKPLAKSGTILKEEDYRKTMASMARDLEKLSDNKFIQPAWISMFYSRAGLTDDAIRWMEHGLQMHDQDLPYMFIYYDSDESIINNPRVLEIKNKMGLRY